MNEIVTYNGQPALVLGREKDGKVVSLKLGKNHFATVLADSVKPYTGNQDAVTLGLSSAD
jgi:hypothetical protein